MSDGEAVVGLSAVAEEGATRARAADPRRRAENARAVPAPYLTPPRPACGAFEPDARARRARASDETSLVTRSRVVVDDASV